MLFIKTFLDVVISVANLATISVSEESSYLNSNGNLENGYVVIGKTVSGESLQLSDVFVDRTDAVTKRDYILNTQLSATVVNV